MNHGNNIVDMTDIIFIENMKFFANHGNFDFEKENGQPFIISVKLSVSDLSKAGKSDCLADTINYAEIFKLVKNVTENSTFNLLESLAETIAAEVLQSFSMIKKININIKKPQAPIIGFFDSVGVEINRVRE